jgi:hypothetical protein
MSAAQRVREPIGPPDKDKADWSESFAKLFTAGVGRIAEIQKKSIDVAAQQHTEFVDLWKKAIQKLPGAPGLFLLELQAGGFDRYAEIHKAAVDLAVEQSKAFSELLKTRTAMAGKAGEDVDDFAKKSVERVIAMQKNVLDQSATQARAVIEKSSRQFGEGSPVESAAESMQRGVDAIVDAQKELLDMAVR